MYKLLALHMNPSPAYIFGHAEVAGMLATGHEAMSSYEGYVRECKKRDISTYSQETYEQFMKDCNRPIKLDLAHIGQNYDSRTEGIECRPSDK